MRAARLHGAREIRLDEVSAPGSPAEGEVLLRVRAVGLCGSDLHMFKDARIGDTEFSSPLVLGHEFMGEVAALGGGALGGDHQPLQVGQRVAVDRRCPRNATNSSKKDTPTSSPSAFMDSIQTMGRYKNTCTSRLKIVFLSQMTSVTARARFWRRWA